MMLSFATTSILAAKDPDWIQVVIVVGIVLFSLFGSAAKWIVKQLTGARERAAQQRGRPIIELDQRPDRDEDESPAGIPPFAAPPPPVLRTPRRAAPPTPPVMERVFEVLLEKSAGTPLERRVRELMPPRPAPPPKRETELGQKKPIRSAALKRPKTIAEREAQRARAAQTEAEREAQRLAERERRFTEQTDQRIGHVQTHIAAQDLHDPVSEEFQELIDNLDSAAAVRRALVLSEILAPPVALR